MAGLSVAAILLLPRQFHVTFVENRNIKDIRRSRWMFPLYLVLINLLVLPIARRGPRLAPKGGSDNALLLLAVPLSRGETADRAHRLHRRPFGLDRDGDRRFDRGRHHGLEPPRRAPRAAAPLRPPALAETARQRDRAEAPCTGDMTGFILAVRRVAIFVVVMLGYLYFRSARGEALAAIGLLSFAAIAQIFPSFLAALFWRRANARGALCGADRGQRDLDLHLAAAELRRIAPRPRSPHRPGPDGRRHGFAPSISSGFELPPLAHGVFWSMAAKCRGPRARLA